MAGQGLPTDITSCSEAVPPTLQELQANQANLLQICQYCKAAYANPGSELQVFEETKNYTHDALVRVAYQVYTTGVHLANFLQVQSNELDRLDLEIRSISSRLNACHAITGTSSFIDRNALKLSAHSKDAMHVRRLEREELDGSTEPPARFDRQPHQLMLRFAEL
eukprot:CAMPEP_0177641174 /NCGR_PEP_ID=MMETSP0447-20121125/6929_1 /TAXON_ID=0 /ORGANISM="Stygamoeba regulata, Strain BSH-02190019" /LENGTH=164 /DNA_ID=CAMNT_0019143281 /DNA_START=119 /DNA_END=610 /DNA_ORIENTATION=+